MKWKKTNKLKRAAMGVSVLVLGAGTVLAFAPMRIQAQPDPIISAVIDANMVEVLGFTPGTNATVKVYDSPGGALLVEQSVPIDDGGRFDLPDTAWAFETNILPNMQVEVTDNGTTPVTKTLDVPSMSFDALDVATDIATGTAPADAAVKVEVNTSTNPCLGDTLYTFNTTTNGSGQWMLDVAAQGGDVLQNRGGSLVVNDADGDFARIGFDPRTFGANLRTDEISAWQGWWDANANVNVAIYAADGAQLFSGTTSTDVFGGFVLTYADHGVNLGPGMRVVISDSDDTLDYMLTDVDWDSLVNNIAVGHAPAGTIPCAEGEIEFESGTGKGLRPLDMDASGNWTMDFTAEPETALGGSLGFRFMNGAATITTYMPAAQGVTDLTNTVNTLVAQDELTPLQGVNLKTRLRIATPLIRADLDLLAVTVMNGFNRQVERYVDRDQLAELRGEKLLDDSNAVISAIQDN